ncbi:MAG: T9SS type A sorting domain-containing protein [Flavobacteriales bacterium]|nr:T9SS type A sorting domain-containing protein [Flavobacteriales bacterium]
MSEETVLGIQDLIKHFTIWKYDPFGEMLESELNGFEILLGETLGIVSFINCRDFPSTEQSMLLAGKLNPTFGYYQLTHDEVYSWDIGDTLQYVGTNPGPYVGSGVTSTKLLTIENRIESSDSVWIYFNQYEQVEYVPENLAYGVFNINYPNRIVYRKGDNISPYPNHSVSPNGSNYSHTISSTCGIPRKVYEATSDYIFYCDSCHCFTPYDGFNQTLSNSKHKEGLGLTNVWSATYGFGGQLPPNAHLQYSNVGGFACGTYLPLNIQEQSMPVSFKPNPVIDILDISTDIEFKKIDIFNTFGELSFSKELQGYSHRLPFGHLNTGLYFAQILFANGRTKVIKIVKE